MWNLFIALAVFFFVLANVLFSDLKYEKLIREIDYLLKGDKPIENDEEITILGIDLAKEEDDEKGVIKMTDKKIIIDNNGVKEEYLCFYYDGEYESFKNIFERCAPRIRSLLINNIEELDKLKNDLYFDDGWYEFTPKNVRDIWKCDTPEKAFLKMSKINCSYRWAKVDDVNKHYSPYLPFPFKLSENIPLALDAVRAGNYLLIKVAGYPQKGLKTYNEGLKEYYWRKNAGCIYSCNGFFVNDVCVEEYSEHEKELPKNEK